MTTRQISEQSVTIPAALLRIEGLLMLGASVTMYIVLGYSWLAFALLLFLPDVTILAYGINKRVGAAAYNTVHSLALPLTLGLIAWLAGWGLGQQAALIWMAHIGMDRAAGYGLKYSTDFKDTHLNRV